MHFIFDRLLINYVLFSYSLYLQTIVTSTTLTGRKRKLEAEDGDRYQVDVLSNADVWVPSANADTSSEITQCLQTQLVVLSGVSNVTNVIL